MENNRVGTLAGSRGLQVQEPECIHLSSILGQKFEDLSEYKVKSPIPFVNHKHTVFPFTINAILYLFLSFLEILSPFNRALTSELEESLYLLFQKMI